VLRGRIACTFVLLLEEEGEERVTETGEATGGGVCEGSVGGEDDAGLLLLEVDWGAV
jgi:hypothetical protein